MPSCFFPKAKQILAFFPFIGAWKPRNNGLPNRRILVLQLHNILWFASVSHSSNFLFGPRYFVVVYIYFCKIPKAPTGSGTSGTPAVANITHGQSILLGPITLNSMWHNIIRTSTTISLSLGFVASRWWLEIPHCYDYSLGDRIRDQCPLEVGSIMPQIPLPHALPPKSPNISQLEAGHPICLSGAYLGHSLDRDSATLGALIYPTFDKWPFKHDSSFLFKK